MTDEEAPLEYFTEAELTAVARMLIAMLRIDGRASEAEHDALAMFAKRVRVGERSPADGPYRAKTADDGVDGVAILRPYLDRAAEQPVSREEFVRAAESIQNKEAREAIYAALYDISAADLIVGQEWELLKILMDTWKLEVV
jgi:hypothetical protein